MHTYGKTLMVPLILVYFVLCQFSHKREMSNVAIPKSSPLMTCQLKGLWGTAEACAGKREAGGTVGGEVSTVWSLRPCQGSESPHGKRTGKARVSHRGDWSSHRTRVHRPGVLEMLEAVIHVAGVHWPPGRSGRLNRVCPYMGIHIPLVTCLGPKPAHALRAQPTAGPPTHRPLGVF